MALLQGAAQDEQAGHEEGGAESQVRYLSHGENCPVPGACLHAAGGISAFKVMKLL